MTEYKEVLLFYLPTVLTDIICDYCQFNGFDHNISKEITVAHKNVIIECNNKDYYFIAMCENHTFVYNSNMFISRIFLSKPNIKGYGRSINFTLLLIDTTLFVFNREQHKKIANIRNFQIVKNDIYCCTVDSRIIKYDQKLDKPNIILNYKKNIHSFYVYDDWIFFAIMKKKNLLDIRKYNLSTKKISKIYFWYLWTGCQKFYFSEICCDVYFCETAHGKTKYFPVSSYKSNISGKFIDHDDCECVTGNIMSVTSNMYKIRKDADKTIVDIYSPKSI